MGLLQRAVETYDANQNLVGIYREGHAPLAPIGHLLTSANIEVTLDREGKFLSARRVDKSEPKIIIPVTEDSAGRTSAAAKMPHPLCEQIKHLTAEENYYLPQLALWQKSEFTHPFLEPILGYLRAGSLRSDLLTSIGALKEDDLVCWRVVGFPDEEPACWKNTRLMHAFTEYYGSRISKRENVLCMVDGTQTVTASQHLKGIIPVNGNAKLISANDTSGFTFRGRFSSDWQAATVGYVNSQKAHNALRWLASEQGVREAVGTRTFLCWSPQGVSIPKPTRSFRSTEAAPQTRPSDYRGALSATLMSYRKDHRLTGNEQVVLAAFDAATTGRLSLVYYNEFQLDLFMDRIKEWDNYCCWYNGRYGIQSFNLLEIVKCAFGTQRNNMLETDDRAQRLLVQRLLDCKVNGGVFPADMKEALVQRASTPAAYEESSWRAIVRCACAAIQKYHYDTKQGGDEMSWNLDKQDRSFQYGRLLAVMERAEADFYYKTNETRQTNAIKFMSEYRQRPWTVFERINRQLHQAYLNRIDPWQAVRYERLKDEICKILCSFDEKELNLPLTDLYLIGYELQRGAFFEKSKENTPSEE